MGAHGSDINPEMVDVYLRHKAGGVNMGLENRIIIRLGMAILTRLIADSVSMEVLDDEEDLLRECYRATGYSPKERIRDE